MDRAYERLAFTAYFLRLSVLAVVLWRRPQTKTATAPPTTVRARPPIRHPELRCTDEGWFGRSGQCLICQRPMRPRLRRRPRGHNERTMLQNATTV